MDTLEQLNQQLGSLDELRTIVKTMKALSAASIHQYEQAVKALAGYARTIERGLHVVLEDFESLPAAARRAHATPRRAAIVFGSDHGLCGRFNEEIARFTATRLAAHEALPQPPLLLAVGARVAASLEQQGHTLEETIRLPGSAAQITATVQAILIKVDAWRSDAGIDHVGLYFNRHAGRSASDPGCLELLPLDLRRLHRLEKRPWPSRGLPTFSMARATLLRRLLHQYLFVSIYRACAESQAAEHASRLASMQSAQRNLDERLEELTLAYRRARQSTITAELLDVVAGFEAITSAPD